MYRIGEAAQRVGVSASALRLWERQGLLRPSRSDRRYRLYTDADLEQLRTIRRLRQVDRLNAPGIRRVLRAGRDPHASDTGVDGRLLRRLREARGLSLREAGRRAGLSTSFVSALERGATGASVASLQRLATAYDTTLAELFGDHRRSSDRLVRAGEREPLRLAVPGVRIESLARAATRLEPHLFVLAPGASSEGSYAHEGEEFLYLLTGSLTVWVGDDEVHHLAEPGDALSFPSTLPHRWRNDAERETQLLWINTPPSF